MQVNKRFWESKLVTFCAGIALLLSAFCVIEDLPVYANMIGPPPLSSLMRDCTYAVIVEVSKVDSKYDARVAECQVKGVISPDLLKAVGELSKNGPGRVPLITYKTSRIIAKTSADTKIPIEFKREFISFTWDCANPRVYFPLKAPAVGSKIIIIGLSQGYMYVDYNGDVEKKLTNYFKLSDTNARTKYSEENFKAISAFSGSV